MPLQERSLYTRWKGADERGADRARRRHSPAERVEAIGEPRGDANRLRRDGLDSDFQQQLDAGAKTVNPGGIQRSRFPPPRVGQEIERRLDEFPAAVDIRPAVLDDVEAIAMLLRHVEDRSPFRTAHPFVSVRGEKR